MENQLITFNELLENEAPNPPKETTKRIYECLKKEGDETTYRTIQRYRRGQIVPSLKVAKIILKVTNIEVPDTTLLEILEYSKQSLKDNKKEKNNRKPYTPFVRHEENDKANKVEQTININFSNIDIGASVEITKGAIEERIARLYGSEDFEKYVEELITYDIKNEILKGEKYE